MTIVNKFKIKKIYIIICIVILTFSFCISASAETVTRQAEGPMNHVYTPNGTEVQLRDMASELSDGEFNSLLNDAQTSSYNYQILGNPTNYYNCHSYAWFFRGDLPEELLKSYWIDDPMNYILDGSYIEINISEVFEGDIITYWEDGKITHSGIVKKHSGIVDVTSIDTIYVHSKLGNGALVGHFANRVEYFTNETVIKFYKFAAAHVHDFENCISNNGFTHTGYCIVCKRNKTESHTLYREGAFYKCTSCNYKEIFKPVIMKGTTYYLYALDNTQTPMTLSELKFILAKSNYQDNSFLAKLEQEHLIID